MTMTKEWHKNLTNFFTKRNWNYAPPPPPLHSTKYNQLFTSQTQPTSPHTTPHTMVCNIQNTQNAVSGLASSSHQLLPTAPLTPLNVPNLPWHLTEAQSTSPHITPHNTECPQPPLASNRSTVNSPHHPSQH